MPRNSSRTHTIATPARAGRMEMMLRQACNQPCERVAFHSNALRTFRRVSGRTERSAVARSRACRTDIAKVSSRMRARRQSRQCSRCSRAAAWTSASSVSSRYSCNRSLKFSQFIPSLGASGNQKVQFPGEELFEMARGVVEAGLHGSFGHAGMPRDFLDLQVLIVSENDDFAM